MTQQDQARRSNLTKLKVEDCEQNIQIPATGGVDSNRGSELAFLDCANFLMQVAVPVFMKSTFKLTLGICISLP